MDYAYKITTHGRAVMAACMALEAPFRVTRVAFGSGKIKEDAELADTHALLQYVSEGAVADRAHQDDRLTITIQYANSAHAEVPAFLLSEFIVYTEDPETGLETDLLYGTLGDYRQPVPAYNPAYPPSVFNFPLEIILSSELSVQVSAPAGLVTWDDMDRLKYGETAALTWDLDIPPEGWEADDETGGEYPLHLDIAGEEIEEAMIPNLVVLPESLDAAAACRLCPTARTLNGALRVYAKAAPTETLRASLTLLRDVEGREDITIPAEGWTANGETGGTYPFCVDIKGRGIKGDLIPMVTVLPESLGAAASCGLSPLSRTMKDTLRVYARTVPDKPIRASLALIRNAPGLIRYTASANYAGSGSGGDELPLATAARAGVVKPGNGLRISPDGTLSIDAASSNAVTSLFNASKAGPGQE